MRSDIRGYQPAIEIVPRTTRISLSDRFRMLQSRPVVEQVRVVPGPVRNLQMALQMAGQSAQLPQRRLPVRQRLGPRPGVRVRNKHLLRLQHKAGFKKKLVQTMTVRRRPLHTRLTLKPVNSFRQKVPVHNGQNNTFRPRLV